MKSQKGNLNKICEDITMNGTIERINFTEVKDETEQKVGNFSGFSMAAVGGSILMCIGIVIYAILTH